MKTKLTDILNEGWVEKFEFGFGHKAVVYGRGNEMLIYDEREEFVIAKYEMPKGNETNR